MFGRLERTLCLANYFSVRKLDHTSEVEGLHTSEIELAPGSRFSILDFDMPKAYKSSVDLLLLFLKLIINLHGINWPVWSNGLSIQLKLMVQISLESILKFSE